MKLHSTESLLEHGRLARREHRLKHARSLFRKALDESRSSDDKSMRATLYAELAYVERSLGEPEHAKTHYLRAAEICCGLNLPLRWAHNARHAADILREQGKRVESDRLYAEVIEAYRGSADAVRLDLANAIRGYALLKTHAGAHHAAAALWEEARNLYQLEDISSGVEECDRHIERLKSE